LSRKYDLQVHTIYSMSPNYAFIRDAFITFEDLILQTKQKGLSGIAVTDHNSVTGALKFQKLVRSKDINLDVIIGEEIRTTSGDIIGLYLEERIPPGKSAQETLELINDTNGISIAAHPYARSGVGEDVVKGCRFDALETQNSKHCDVDNNRAGKLARQLDLAEVGGSDAHQSCDVGNAYTLVPDTLSLTDAVKDRKTSAIMETRSPPISDARRLLYQFKLPRSECARTMQDYSGQDFASVMCIANSAMGCGFPVERSVEVRRILIQSMASIDHVKLTVLAEDSLSTPDLTAKHGFSCLVETKSAASSSRILMDAGPPPNIALNNADLLKIDLRSLNAIVISHGHYDHLGGLPEILKRVREPTPVIVHPLAFVPKFSLTPNLKFIGANFDQRTLKELQGVLLLARNSVPVTTGVITSGEISRETGFEKVEGFWTVENQHFIQDQMVDDQALIVNLREKGLVIVSGCGHSGIINTVRHAQKMTGVEKIHTIIGGCHLANANQEKLQATVDELLKIQPDRLYPCHCTGPKTINKFLESFGERCKAAHTGDIIEL